ncbi:transforming growth factor-beta receptor-associated protein 1 [Cucurbita moschata]|uniref:Transforming growth factor-beta receptor-associated protein 1 n=1 Tax=Cucurbita moschata TaxID=3662 RepID=A0A6J1EKN6_CUCMO|nr:transforming growth factor-beta receptor-associated protein 1 [Cucurbita moschata]
MAKPERAVLEPLGEEFDISTHFRTSIRSLAVSPLSDSQTLIFAGTKSGALILFSATPESSSFTALGSETTGLDAAPRVVSSSEGFSLVRSVAVSVSSIVYLNVLRGIDKVLVLCSDGFLYIVDSLLLVPVKRLTGLKGVSLITKRIRSSESECSSLYGRADSNSGLGSPRQRLLQSLGSGIRTNGLKIKESEWPQEESNCVFAALVGKRLILFEVVLGRRTGRNERGVNDANESLLILKELQCTEGVSTMVWLNDSIIVGTASGYYLVSCVTGANSLIFKLPELSSPPCLKLLQKEWKVLLLMDRVGITVNAYGQPVGGSLVFHDLPNSVAEISSYVVVASSGQLKLYHRNTGSCIQTITFNGNGIEPCIVADEEDGSGDVIAVAVTNKVMCYKKVPCDEQIKDLLRRKNFKEAISLAEDLECAGEMSKDMLYFVHAQIGFLLLFDLQFEEAVNHFLQSETMQPSEIFPFVMKDPNRWSLLIPRNRYWAMHPPPSPFEDVIDDGLLAIQRATFLKKVGVETAVNEDFLLNPPSRSDLLESAVKHIVRYFEASRQKELTSAVREGVDTLLMCLYRTLNSIDKMEELASSANSCVVEELESLLEDSGHLRTLAFLYASKGMSSKALAIWRILGRNYPSRLLKDSSMDEGTLDNNVVDISGKETAAAEASKILEESSDQALVLQHLGWIADINQHFATQILTSEKRSSQLSPDDIIRAIDPKKVEILQRYIQWLIEEKESCDPHFHSLYALSLAKSAVEVESTQNLDSSSDTKISDQRINSMFEQPIRERLQIFLQSSDLYDPEEVLDLIEGSELWLEKAILYRKLGQEALVLRILALKLEDSEAAEQYCAEIGRSDAYMQLLDMYLDPQNGKEPMFKAAVRLLHNHGEFLDPLRVLETLSPDMPLQIASETILKVLRARVHHHRQGQILHSTSRALDLEARLARLEERSRHVQINDESLCDSCHARLGTKLFAMYPDDTIVCYKCYRRQGESTSVTGRNFKQDILIKPGWLVMD